jgi:hypothetical protein
MKGNRKFLWNFKTPTRGYAFDVPYLPRAKDDNFSPSSFKGLDQPVQYMVKNGHFHISSTIDPREIGRYLAMLAYDK